MSQPKALSKVDEQGVQAIVRKERKVIRKARKVVERGALDATAIDDDGNPVAPGVLEGWDARRMRVAQDMRKAKRQAPVYIDVLTKTLESHDKLEAERNKAAPVQLNIGTINLVKAEDRPQYQVIDIEPVKEG